MTKKEEKLFKRLRLGVNYFKCIVDDDNCHSDEYLTNPENVLGIFDVYENTEFKDELQSTFDYSVDEIIVYKNGYVCAIDFAEMHQENPDLFDYFNPR